MPRHKSEPNPSMSIRLCFWCPRRLVMSYKAALAAKASTISLDLRQHMGRVVEEQQATTKKGKG